MRIRELKEAIQALHQNGFRVIMDVVYNHTYKLDSWLWRTEPWYFYRQNPDGSPADGSGCGNDLASERSMCARYILESVLYWAREYHMDGFRFDLMALLDTQLMERIRAALDREYGKGEKILFGEPWSAHSSPMHRGAKPAGKRALPTLDENTGAFCDATRDLVKGHILHAERPGFVNGGSARLSSLSMAVTGWAGGPGRAVRRPVRLPDHQLPVQPRRLDPVGQAGHHHGPRPLFRPAHPRRPAGQPAGGGLLLRLPGALVHAGGGRVRPHQAGAAKQL